MMTCRPTIFREIINVGEGTIYSSKSDGTYEASKMSYGYYTRRSGITTTEKKESYLVMVVCAQNVLQINYGIAKNETMVLFCIESSSLRSY